jgi:cytidylate kinase
MTRPMVIAIDGPAASGKSSTAQWVAEQLGILHVDSGAIYRALTALALERDPDPARWTTEMVLDGGPRITLVPGERSVLALIDGVRDDDRLRSAAVTGGVSTVASMPPARAWVNARVRDAAKAHAVVIDGRDIGTVVFPDATLKVFLVADPWERARRRLQQRLGRAPAQDEIAEETERLGMRCCWTPPTSLRRSRWPGLWRWLGRRPSARKRTWMAEVCARVDVCPIATRCRNSHSMNRVNAKDW